MATNSRGEAISAYSPAFNKGAKVFSANIKMSVITGTIVSAGPTYGVSHGLGSIPAVVVVSVRGTATQLSAKAGVGESTASARTSSKVYVAGAAKGVKYQVLSILG